METQERKLRTKTYHKTMKNYNDYLYDVTHGHIDDHHMMQTKADVIKGNRSVLETLLKLDCHDLIIEIFSTKK